LSRRFSDKLNDELDILYRDDALIAINKPSGLLVHRTAMAADATEFAVQQLRDQIGREVHPCHRLDRPTSGVLLFAFDRPTLAEMQQRFAAREIRKTYIAVVRGWTAPRGRIDYPIRSEKNPTKSREAVTDYVRIATCELPHPVGPHATARLSLLRLTPQTGRPHQLRRHLAHLRHPILGDSRHGDGAQNRFARTHLHSRRLLLHALAIAFTHPRENRPVLIQAAPNADFREALTLCGMRDAIEFNAPNSL